VLTVLFAVGAAVCNALASILQRLGVRSIPDRESMRPALLVAALRKPVWLLGLLAMVGAFGCQAAALTDGDLALVQPILLAELPVTLLLAPLFFQGTALPGRRAWVGVAGMSAGLAAVLLAASPGGGHASAGLTTVLLTSAATGGLIVVVVLLALRLDGSPKAAAFGTAAGTGFALTAALMKQAMSRYDTHGFAAIFGAWELYVMAVTGLISLFLWQNALQAGTLAAAQPAITLSDPVFSTFIGVLAFGERVRLGGWLAIELLGALVVTAASVELARSPLVSGNVDLDEAAQREPGAINHPGAEGANGRRAARSPAHDAGNANKSDHGGPRPRSSASNADNS
jgi:drug/metabolite transporter (DMT)-like permease